jgi:hypothetical protein
MQVARCRWPRCRCRPPSKATEAASSRSWSRTVSARARSQGRWSAALARRNAAHKAAAHHDRMCEHRTGAGILPYEGLTLIKFGRAANEPANRWKVDSPPALGNFGKLWHPLGAPDAFPPHAGGLLGSKRVLDIMSGPSANLNPVVEICSPGPRKSRFGTPLEPCRSRTQPRARCPRGRLRLPCTPGRSAGGCGRRAPSVSWICSRAFPRRFCPPRPRISPKFRRKEPRKAPTGGLGRPPEPERGPPAPTRVTPTWAGVWVGRGEF